MHYGKCIYSYVISSLLVGGRAQHSPPPLSTPSFHNGEREINVARKNICYSDGFFGGLDLARTHVYGSHKQPARYRAGVFILPRFALFSSTTTPPPFPRPSRCFILIF